MTATETSEVMAASQSVPSERGVRRDVATLVTGAGGEVGHGLMAALHAAGRKDIIAIDIRALDDRQRALCREAYVGDICETALLGRLQSMYEITEVYHLAALLSTRTEFVPEAAHAVNVGGMFNLLRLAADQARSHGKRVRFMFPSSIAVYGLGYLKTKKRAGAIGEDQYLQPTTMYGCNKVYCESLGRYYARHYRQLAQDRMDHILDFRCIRFPGLISAETVPCGGTSDYAAQMIHAAAEGKPYACFVRPDTRMAFMTMPDAIEAFLGLAGADAGHLSRCVYNVTSFNPSAAEFADLVREHFPAARISFEPDPQRQAIVDSWPVDVDDTAARTDWGYSPKHDLRSAFEQYLVPNVTARYAKGRA